MAVVVSYWGHGIGEATPEYVFHFKVLWVRSLIPNSSPILFTTFVFSHYLGDVSHVLPESETHDGEYILLVEGITKSHWHLESI